jgi:hypothetical protein
MRIVVTGSSGLIGSALVPALRADSHEVRRLVRRRPAGADESQWDPARRTIDDGALDGIDAVVNLAGAGVADRRWTESYKRKVLDSRIDATTTIVDAAIKAGVSTLISGSAVGYYGERGDAILDEADAAGDGFLPRLVQKWEAATQPAADAGIRVVTIRSGIVQSADGGALGKVLPIFKLGLGGRLSSGNHWLPWIALSDEIAAIRFLLDHDEVSGAVNVCGPEPVRNREYTAALGRAVHRPTLAVVPRFALRAAFAGFADEGALVSQRVIPRKLLDAGFEFRYVDIDAALQAIV